MEQRCECHTDPRYDPLRQPCPRCTIAIDAADDARTYPED
jgi:hypothetical protein